MTINDFEIANDEIKKYYGTDKVLELPKSIKSIGVEAFKNCFDIEKIILNEGIKKIDKQAFVNCANLKSVNIPNSLTDIDPTAFMYANNIIEFIVSDDNQYYKAIKGSLYSKDESVLLFYANGLTKTSFTVPNSVYYIRDYAFFANKTLKKVIIGSNTKWIGNYAFCESKLESVKLPKWLSTICTGSFQFTNLKKIEIPCNVTSICENAFLQCPAKKIFLPSTLLSVATGGLMVSEVPTIFFSGDKENWDLITLYDNAIVPNASVKIIGRKNKWSEKELKIYQQENNIETNAKKQLKDFVIEEGILKEYRGSETTIYLPHTITKISSEFKCKNKDELKKIVCSNSIYEIERNALRGYQGLENIVLPENLLIIGPYALTDCQSLRGISINESIRYIAESFTGYRCYRLNSLVVDPRNHRYLSKNDIIYTKDGKKVIAYATGKNAKEIKLISKVVRICPYVFKNVECLEAIVLPNSVESIGVAAFSECKKLRYVKLSKKLRIIEPYAFSSCYNLEKIELPTSLEYIDAKAFDVCTKLTSVVYLGSKEEWQSHPEFTDAIPQQAILTFKKNK